MNRNWFLAKVRYPKETDQGLLKNITEQYLVDAVSHSEAETIIYDRVGDMIRGDFQLKRLTPLDIADVFEYEDSDIWHSAKISYRIAEESGKESGKEKKIVQTMLVTAHDCLEAYNRIQESLSTMLVSFRITDVKETAIIEVFPYARKDGESERL